MGLLPVGLGVEGISDAVTWVDKADTMIAIRKAGKKKNAKSADE
jgi:hypothetical protein